jgi:hypothetical protein
MRGFTSGDYAGGQFFFSNNGGDFSALSSNTWDNAPAGGYLGTYDAAFVADFSSPSVAAAPEPSALALFGMASAGLAGYFGRKLRNQAVAA